MINNTYMKKTLLFSTLLLGSLVFAQKTDANMPGGDKDVHGCAASAGYIYSQINKDCIRPFEQKIELEGQDPEYASIQRTAVIFSKDMKKAEIFIPSGKESSMVLTKKGKEVAWKNGDYTLIPVKKRYEIRKKDVVIFK